MNKRLLIPAIVIVAAVVIVAVIISIMLANHRPSIDSLEANPQVVVPLGSCQIVCTASDADDDELSYNWSASGGEINGLETMLTWITWTAPSSTGSYNVTVTVTDGRGGEVMDYVTIEVSDNEAPAIADLIADAEWTFPLDSIQVTCTALDPDKDVLSYEWTTDGGDISGTGMVVNWTAPEKIGLYNITVVVTDDHGMSDTKTVSVHSALVQPAIIEDLLITADHCYLKKYSWGYKVGKEQKYHIECILSDTSVEASYQWSCDVGTISGEGSMITWTAPNEYVEETTVAVTVPSVGTKSLVLEVVSCSSCTFRC